MGKTNIARAEQLRKDGKTYEEIAQEMGVTKQAVYSALKNAGRIRRRYETIFEECPYVGLRKFLLENKKLKIYGIARGIFGGVSQKEMAKVHRILRGDDVLVTFRNIKNLETMTGMGFDELFATEESNDS